MKNLNDLIFTGIAIETTGLNIQTDDIIKITATKFTKSKNVDYFEVVIKPSHPLSEFYQQLTGMTHADFEQAVSLEEALRGLVNFCEKSVIVAHNAEFVMNFIQEKLRQYHLDPIHLDTIDTLELVRGLYPYQKRHNLETIARLFGIDYCQRDYVQVLAKTFRILLGTLQGQQDIRQLRQLVEFAKEKKQLRGTFTCGRNLKQIVISLEGLQEFANSVEN